MGDILYKFHSRATGPCRAIVAGWRKLRIKYSAGTFTHDAYMLLPLDGDYVDGEPPELTLGGDSGAGWWWHDEDNNTWHWAGLHVAGEARGWRAGVDVTEERAWMLSIKKQLTTFQNANLRPRVVDTRRATGRSGSRAAASPSPSASPNPFNRVPFGRNNSGGKRVKKG